MSRQSNMSNRPDRWKIRLLLRSVIPLKAGIIFLVVLNLLLHFYKLDTPNSAVYDEVHFGKYGSSYCCTHTRQFDVHPPHGKMILAAPLKLTDYDGQFPFEKIGDSFEGHVPVIAFRIVPAIFGFALPFLVLWFFLLVGVPANFALLGSFLISIENGFVVQSRYAVMDAVLVGFTLLAICIALQAIKKVPKKIFYALIFLAGATSALATGAKFTGGVSLIIICFLLLKFFKNLKILSLSVLSLFAGFSLFYLGGWAIHFHVLTEPSSADVFFIRTGDFFYDLWVLHQRMFLENERLKPHSDASHWWQWFAMIKSVYYWTDSKSDIFFTGNVFTWLGTNLALIPAFIILLEKNIFKNYRWIGPLGFVVTMAPFLFFNRPLFLYHYLLSLLFGFIAVITALNIWFETKPSRSKYFVKTACALCILAVLGFILTAPLTYGYGDQDHLLFKIGPFWR